MIKNIKVNYFKCFEKEELEFRPFTILTGTNSSGKSSLIQAILLSGNHGSGSDMLNYIDSLGNFDDLKNRYTNPKEYSIEIMFTDKSTQIFKGSKDFTGFDADASRHLAYPSNLVYLNSNRISINEINNTNNTFNQDRYFGI
ncbi:MAG: AAA family ATPase, partial [Arcobacteraceae bacterium]|nr:AAA family ATPase [Arcobacteraceae bacterium]